MNRKSNYVTKIIILQTNVWRWQLEGCQRQQVLYVMKCPLSGLTCARGWLSVSGGVGDRHSDPGEVAGRDAEWRRDGEREASRWEEAVSYCLNG